MTKVEEALAQMEQMLEKPPHVKTASEIATLFAATGEIADLERAILRHMEHHMAREREWCARIVELHECWVRDHSRCVFAERIAKQIRERRAPDDRELKFARTMKMLIPGEA